MNNRKQVITYVVIALVATVSIGGFVLAQNVGDQYGNINAENVYLSAPSGDSGQNGESSFGGSTQSDWGVGGALTVTGASTFSGSLVSPTSTVERLNQGGNLFATSTAAQANAEIAVGTLTEAQIIANNRIDLTTTGDTTHTMTLPATSTMTTMIPNAGDSMILKYRVIGTAAVASSTIAAGTGMDLLENENGDVIIEAGNEAYIRFYREADTDVTVTVDEYIAAD